MYEQLYPDMFSLSNAGPAVINALIEGITCNAIMLSSILLHTSGGKTTPRFLSKCP